MLALSRSLGSNLISAGLFLPRLYALAILALPVLLLHQQLVLLLQFGSLFARSCWQLRQAC